MTQPTAVPSESRSSPVEDFQAKEQGGYPRISGTERPRACISQENDVPAGYPKLATWMGLVPETAVFRRFGFLNKLNLLYLQAELKYLEEKLKEIQRRDCQGAGHERLYARDFFFLNNMEDGMSEQLDLMMRIRERLEKYNTAIIQQSQILPMSSPTELDLAYIQNYMANKEMGPFALAGIDSEIWGSIHERKGHEADIVTLLPRKGDDMFTKLLIEKGTPALFKYGVSRFLTPSPVHGLVGFEDSTLSRLAYLTTTALASLLPVASIVVLYFVSSMKMRLGIIAIFTVLLSFSLAFFTSAKRTEIFALTAAFSAVQVVFVQVGVNGA
ncbi:hypothetical protein EV356DRAFT_349349 [Viridothelium virens]|uniref:DUF6594 domain-containing protein n=1 Tax=Viridothelium virens TaxID=1048519 RepID=A0A6A6GXD0_VIRVR|nr:hypothetical protein EV356DRAFT_349349 [Viridothelium virens]